MLGSARSETLDLELRPEAAVGAVDIELPDARLLNRNQPEHAQYGVPGVDALDQELVSVAGCLLGSLVSVGRQVSLPYRQTCPASRTRFSPSTLRTTPGAWPRSIISRAISGNVSGGAMVSSPSSLSLRRASSLIRAR